jgi:radical SAM protein with 4Fe4S-binding SPASM domain
MYSKFKINGGSEYYICNRTNAIFDANKIPFHTKTGENAYTLDADGKIDSRITGSIEKSNKPRRMRIQLGQACNYDCSYCFQKDIGSPLERRESPFMDMFFNNMKKFDISDLQEIQPWGGEPFLYWKDMKKLFEFFDKPGMTWYISTNGSTLHKKHIDFFKRMKSRIQIGISHDGPGQEELRGEEIFDKPRVREVLKSIKEVDNVSWSVNTVVTKSNYNVFEMSEFFYDIFKGLDSISTPWHYQVGRLYTDALEVDHHYSQSDELILSGDELKQFGKLHRKFLKVIKDSPMNYNYNNIDGMVNCTNFSHDVIQSIVRVINNQHEQTHAHEASTNCGVDWKHNLDMDLRGNVLSCVHSDKKVRSGHMSNIHEVRLVGLDMARKKSPVRGCLKCPVRKQCSGSCPLKLSDETFEKNCAIEKTFYLGFMETALQLVLRCDTIVWLEHGIEHLVELPA